MVISSWFRWDARASTSILVLYKLYGLSALVTWGGSDEIIETWVILQPLSFEICGLDTGLVILRQLGCGLGFTLNKLFFSLSVPLREYADFRMCDGVNSLLFWLVDILETFSAGF